MDKNKVVAPTAKVLFSVPNGEGGADVETLWAHDLGADHYKLDNLPFYAYGVSLNDVVHAPFSAEQKFPTFDKILFKSGNRTIRIILNPPSEPGNESEDLLNKLMELGCGYEGANRSYIAINIPPLVHLSDVIGLLTGSQAQWEHADPTYDELHPGGS